MRSDSEFLGRAVETESSELALPSDQATGCSCGSDCHCPSNAKCCSLKTEHQKERMRDDEQV